MEQILLKVILLTSPGSCRAISHHSRILHILTLVCSHTSCAGAAESLPKGRAGPRPAYLSLQVSDISSEEDFSEMEGEWEAEQEEEGRDESEEKEDQSERWVPCRAI